MSEPAGPGAPASASTADRACDACLRRAWLLGRLAGHLDRVRGRVGALLELDDERLLCAVAGSRHPDISAEHEAFDPVSYRAHCDRAGVETVCRCQSAYPRALRDLAAPPAALHVAGSAGRLSALANDAAVAIVGSRRASPYGLGAARSLARGLGAAELTVVSGMASGIDSAAHAGALEAGAATIAVLAAAPDRPYPASARRVHARIREHGVAVSELGPGVAGRRWMFPARNRIIAALSAMTVVVQAREGSGALVTASCAATLGRLVGAVPGEVTAPLAWGPNELLKRGAELVRSPEDVVAAIFGAGVRPVPPRPRAPLSPQLQGILDALADGREAGEAISEVALDLNAGLAAVTELELGGWIRREAGGGFSVPL